jgi:feruloyl-CoA synthase
MSTVEKSALRPVRMGELSVTLRDGAGGVRYLTARAPLPHHPRTMIEALERHAAAAPDRVFLADRGPDGEWRRLTYAETLARTRSVAQFLIDRGLSAERPLAILSGNSIEHGLLALGAQMAGVPFAAISPAYSLVSSDFAKLRYIFSLLTPGLVFAADRAAFARALEAVDAEAIGLVVARGEKAGAISFDTVLATPPTPAVDAAHAAISGDTVAKFLFTSGSTGMPKAVINTHRMVTCNQAMIAHALAFLQDEPPVMVDWLPWNHTAGGNHNFGIALFNGGTLYIDDGAPTPAGIARTVRNLEEIAPTLYFNVPKGYEMLADHLERNEGLRKSFFSRLKLMQYAGAGLSQHVWDALHRIAEDETGERIMIITGYGSTETAPFASTTTWPVGRPGEVGLPAPGLELKLVPDGEKLELRLRGPSITPGYWRQPDKTAESFDEEGFYRIGDALKFVDPADPDRGLLFDGRVSEDFKLDTGTWVNMAAVRAGLIRACAPLVRDAVLTGLDRPHIGAILILDVDAARREAGRPGAGEAELAADPRIGARIGAALDTLAAQATGSSTLVARAIVLDGPPSIDANEVTDKGSINQRALMAARAQLVEALYTDPVPDGVFVASRKARP